MIMQECFRQFCGFSIHFRCSY